jgi:hypothetical protein
VPGRNAKEAIANFAGFLNETLSCVTDTPLVVFQGSDRKFRLFLEEPVPLSSRSGHRFYLSVVQVCTTAKQDSGEFKVHTLYYSYIFSDSCAFSHHGVVSYHWHPDEFAVRHPHLHIRITQNLGYPEIERRIAKAHFPTSRICLEDFVYLLIKYYDIKPLLGDGKWSHLLRKNKKAFAKGATWVVAHNV